MYHEIRFISFVSSKDRGVNIIAVGIGRRIAKKELENLAGNRGSVIQVADFEALAENLRVILKEVCGECVLYCGSGR